MNLELAYNILEILQTMQAAVKQMRVKYVTGDIEEFNLLSMDLWDGLTAVKEVAGQEIASGSRIRLEDACVCAMESLKDIKMLSITKPEKVEWKLEYELSAIIEIMAVQFFYWGIVDEHPEKREEFQNFLKNTDTFGLLKVPENQREYPIDLTICVTGYNHLDYTMRCVQSILENLPTGIKSELILFNHGSSDDTKAYFESIKDAKVINVAVNGAMPNVLGKALTRGKYNLNISNDVVIGKNAIDNLYRCAAEHPDYGYIVPSTPAVSNFQTIDVQYESPEQFWQFTIQNNIYNERRHEQRVRLCNPLHIVPTVIYTQLSLDMYEDKFCNGQKNSFPDDKNSLWMRRNGYKNILAKDAYCHHFGSVTLKIGLGKNEEQQKFYYEGRKKFFELYGIDPWGTGFCYDKQFFQTWAPKVVNDAQILGINCGLGSNSLKIKEILLEKGATGVHLINCVQDKRYLQDLCGVSDEAYEIATLSDIVEKAGRRKYNYIIVEEPIQNCRQNNLIQALEESGLEYDELIFKMAAESWQVHGTSR